jgi:trimeric autotransporter adhesin
MFTDGTVKAPSISFDSSPSTGIFCPSVGATLFLHNIGESNTAFGFSALANMTRAGANTAVGQGALAAGSNVTNSTAVGYKALGSNIRGNQNTAIGSSALASNRRRYKEDIQPMGDVSARC